MEFDKYSHQDRLKAVIEHSKMSKRALGIALGHINGTIIYNVLSGRNGISAKLANEICTKFPEINYKWLLKGGGEMIVETKPEPKDNLTERIEFLERHIKGQDARIELLERKVSDMASTSNEVPQRA